MTRCLLLIKKLELLDKESEQVNKNYIKSRLKNLKNYLVCLLMMLKKELVESLKEEAKSEALELTQKYY